jgi:hypothetical protein
LSTSRVELDVEGVVGDLDGALVGEVADVAS